jgi:hypothetical protein
MFMLWFDDRLKIGPPSPSRSLADMIGNEAMADRQHRLPRKRSGLIANGLAAINRQHEKQQNWPDRMGNCQQHS